jgi:ribosome-binding factor A
VPWDRSNKLNAIIQEKVAQVVLFRLKDPRMGLVTITRAKLSPDRSECLVFYSVLGSPGQRSATKHALDDARGHIQTEIARTLRMRHIPHLRFVFDESIEGTIRVASILKSLNPESPESTEPPNAAPDEEDGDEEEGEEDDEADEEDEALEEDEEPDPRPE